MSCCRRSTKKFSNCQIRQSEWFHHFFFFSSGKKENKLGCASFFFFLKKCQEHFRFEFFFSNIFMRNSSNICDEKVIFDPFCLKWLRLLLLIVFLNLSKPLNGVVYKKRLMARFEGAFLTSVTISVFEEARDLEKGSFRWRLLWTFPKTFFSKNWLPFLLNFYKKQSENPSQSNLRRLGTRTRRNHHFAWHDKFPQKLYSFSQREKCFKSATSFRYHKLMKENSMIITEMTLHVLF